MPRSRLADRCLRTLPLLAIALLAACGDATPAGWTALDTERSGDCPVLTGRWSLAASEPFNAASDTDVAVRQLLGVPMTATAWTTLSISGDSKRELTLTLTEPATMLTHWLDQQRRQGNRRIADMFDQPEVRWNHGFAEMSDAEYARNLAQIYAKQTHTAQIRHGIDYFCKDGWLVTDRHVPPTVANPAPTPARHGNVRFRRDVDGRLVARIDYALNTDRKRWCGDFCGDIPGADPKQREWQRWPLVMADDNTLPAWAGDFARSPALRIPATPANAAFRTEEVRAHLGSLLPAGVRLDSLGPEDEALAAELQAPDADALARSIGLLRQSGRYPLLEVDAFTRRKNSVRMVLRLGLVPNYATVPVLDIRDQVRALLPAGTDVAGISADGPNHRLRVTADSPWAVSQLLRALAGSGDFRQVELL
ncbi:MAG: PilN domain-containing protein, partial [Moraxellaceae bacterium]